jgi:VWFA-related protein
MLGFMLLKIFAIQLVLLSSAFSQLMEQNAEGKNVVKLPLLIADKNNPAREQKVEAAEIQILENGKPQEIKSVQQRKPEDRLLIAVLLDVSNSQREQFQISTKLAQLAVNGLVRPGIDAVAVGAFEINLRNTNFVTDRDKALPFFSQLSPGGGSSVHDAIYNFCQKLKDPSIRASNVALLLLSDGDDNQSQHTLDDAIRAAQLANVTIFAVQTGLRPSGPYDKGGHVLKELTQETGGLVFDGYSEKDFNQWIALLARALQNRSFATYEVTASDRPRIEVRSSQKKLKLLAPRHRESTITAKQ